MATPDPTDAPVPEPEVSVVVPIYRVEDYLAECLDSLVGQTFRDFEAVLVDDGSPDGSRTIAEAYAARDPRLRLVDRPNGGLGAARNTGVAAARGRWLTFLDSDDRLPPWALERLITTGRETGSDVVVGAADRFDSTGHWPAAWAIPTQAQGRRRTTLAAHPELLRNLYTWDKLFRRDFWDSHGLTFREGVSYEDQPLVTRLLAAARSLDVVPDVVYHYREREDRSSLSQQTSTLADLRDRVAAWEASDAVLREELTPELYDAWRGSLIDFHLVWYLVSPGTADDAYWRELVAAVRRFVGEAPARSWDAAAPWRRVIATLALQDRRDDLRAFLDRQGRRQRKWRAAADPTGIRLRLPLLGDPDLADSLFVVRPEQVEVEHLVEEATWASGPPEGLHLAGWAYLRKVDLAGRGDHEVVVEVRGADGEVRHEVTAAAGPPAVTDPPFPDRHADYRPGRFSVTVPAAALTSSVTLWLRVGTAGLVAATPVAARTDGVGDPGRGVGWSASTGFLGAGPEPRW